MQWIFLWLYVVVSKITAKTHGFTYKKNEGEKLFCFTLPNSSGSPARRHLASTLPETGISAMPRFYGTHFGSQITSEHKMPVQKVSFCIKKSHEKFRMNPAR